MDKYSFWLGVLQAAIPLAIAVLTTVSTVSSNRKKTGNQIDELKESVKQDIDATNKKLEDHIKQEEDDKARQARIRILRFDDELCEGKRHSENYFEDILDDCDAYKKYIAAHPDFRNSRGETAIDHIIETYKSVKAKGGFLTQA